MGDGVIDLAQNLIDGLAQTLAVVRHRIESMNLRTTERLGFTVVVGVDQGGELMVINYRAI